MTRAVLAIGQLRFQAAWEFHPLVYPLLGATLLWLQPAGRKLLRHRTILLLSLVAILGTWCLRHGYGLFPPGF